jgi:hypothetical protein
LLCVDRLLRGIDANFRGQLRHAHRRGIQARQLMQGHVLERAADRRVHPLPRPTDAAQTFDPALAGRAAAFGDGDRPFEDVENLRRRDFIRAPARCKPFSTLLTVGGLRRVRCASSAAARCRAGSCAKLASTTVA